MNPNTTFRFLLRFLLLLGLAWPSASPAAPPVVSNVRASQRPGTGFVDILYDATDAEGNLLAVSVAVSFDRGTNYVAAALNLSGDLGAPVTPGLNKHIVWDAKADLPTFLWPNVRVRVTADDGPGNTPAGMVYVPAGLFEMGDTFSDPGGSNGGTPVHPVQVSAFYMDRNEVTKTLWDDVYLWAILRGYSFDRRGAGKGTIHPVQNITWNDAVKWCNARSEFLGRTPVYYTDATQTNVYRAGTNNLSNANVKWTANGFRLPTEAEWEKAARGGVVGRRFPWGDTITHSNANYTSSTNDTYDLSPTRGPHPSYAIDPTPYTSPVGAFAANGYGLNDMAGSVKKWCWDRYGAYTNALQFDPRGPSSGSQRVNRGGSWNNSANDVRVFDRNNTDPTGGNNTSGFRLAVSPE